jgi:hypothetical protein
MRHKIEDRRLRAATVRGSVGPKASKFHKLFAGAASFSAVAPQISEVIDRFIVRPEA